VRADLVELAQPIAGAWREVAVGPAHTCAVTVAGEASCWGDNGLGQLGGGQVGDGLVPRQVMPGMTWSKVVAGWHSTCAIAASDDSVWCWGLDEEGAIGTEGDAVTPRRLDTLGAGWTGLALHLEHGCAIASSTGDLWCWGDGDDGELGTGADHSPDPTQVGTASWRSVGATDRATCAIQMDGTLWCWGSRGEGMLGDGMETGIVETPQQITTTAGEWDTLAAGPSHVCAIRQTGGTLACWGWNAFNAVDESATQVISTPDDVTGNGWTAISTGGEYYTHSCGLQGDSAFCWGSGLGGRLGVGDTNPRTAPTELTVPSADLWEQISAGGPHSCGLRDGGKLFCWGDHLVMPLGNGRIEGSTTPVQIGTDTGWKQVEAGIYHVCAIDSADRLWCWGDNSQLQLGAGVGMTPDPVAVTAVPAR
jgi:alpha-tubulin suppressor-like RCC1 family protein